jgi:predicted DNA-binding ArsR family transcriptional regulator
MKSKRGGVRKKGKKGSNNWKDPYSSLDPQKNMGRRLDDVEDIQEYVHKLNDKDKAFMAKFMKEYNNASYNADDLSQNLHNTPALKKSITDRNNDRNRCIYTREKAKGMLNYSSSDAELELLVYGSEIEEDVAEEEVEEFIDEI